MARQAVIEKQGPLRRSRYRSRYHWPSPPVAAGFSKAIADAVHTLQYARYPRVHQLSPQAARRAIRRAPSSERVQLAGVAVSLKNKRMVRYLGHIREQAEFGECHRYGLNTEGCPNARDMVFSVDLEHSNPQAARRGERA